MTRVFVIGATGLVGGGIARGLVAAGEQVSGLARTDVATATLTAAGITAVTADLDERLAIALDHAEDVDAVVLAAQLGDQQEAAVVAALIERLRGRTLLFVSGSGVMIERTGGSWSGSSFAEDEAFVTEPLAEGRRAAERAVLAAADAGVRSIVVRPGMIWGPGDHGLVPMIYRSVATTGSACFVGEGRNTYAEVHVEDVVRLVTDALERGAPGAIYHAVGGETPTRWIAESVARDLGVGTRSLSPAEAEDVWGPFGALVAGASSRIRATRTAAALGWRPEHGDMLSEVGEPRLRALVPARPR